MLVAKIQVSKTTIHTEIVTPITSGMIGATVEVSFSEDWADYEKVYVWKHRNRTIDDLDATGIIPHEVLEEYGGVLKFGVYGTKGDIVLPTIYGAIDTVRMGTDPSGDPSVDPSRPVWLKVLNALAAVKLALQHTVKSVNGIRPDENGNVEIEVSGSGGSGSGTSFTTDETLTLKDGVLSVNTTDQMEQDNTLPITSAGVFATVGNIEALLKTI